MAKATRYTNINVGDEPVRLGVDIPANVKTEVAIKARRAGLTMTEVVTRFLAAWLREEIELPEK